MNVGAHLVAAVQHREGGHRAQLPLLLGDDLTAVELAGEEHAELAGQILVELLPGVEADAALDRVEEHARGLAGGLLQGVVHAISLRFAL